MIRLTSNATLFFKLFLPIFYAVFYGFFAGWLVLSTPAELQDKPWLPWANLSLYLVLMAVLLRTVFRLKRIDCAEDHFIVTNYHTARRYTYDSVSSMRVRRFLTFRLARMTFHEKSYFGRSIFFLISPKQVERVFASYGAVLPIDEA